MPQLFSPDLTRVLSRQPSRTFDGPDVDHAAVFMNVDLSVEVARGAAMARHKMDGMADLPVGSAADDTVLFRGKGRNLHVRIVLDPWGH